MKLRAASVAVRLILGLVPAVCVAQDFSADVVYFSAGRSGEASQRTETLVHSPSRLYVSEDKMRLETRGLSGTVLVVDGAEQAAYALSPAKKEYEPLAGGLPEYFRARDVENACPDWQRAAGQKIDCEKVGHEVVDGRQAVKYRNKGATDVAISAVWIDVHVKFVVKWEGAGTGVELRNIQEARQASDLFTLPPDYEVPKPRKGTNKGFSGR
jgi:hypothetical protein